MSAHNVRFLGARAVSAKSIATRVAAMLPRLAVACAATCAIVPQPGIAASANPQAHAAARDDTARWSRIERDARASGDLRLRILFAAPIVDETSGDAIPMPALLESARGSTDPLVLELLLGRCRTRAPAETTGCDPVDLATRWTRVDAENGAAWVELAAVLDGRGDHAGADAAWERAGRASTFRDPQRLLERTLLSVVPATGDPAERFVDVVMAEGIVAAVTVPFLGDLQTGCKVESRRAACGRIADVAFRDADTLSTMAAAVRLTATVGRPASMHRERQRRNEALWWALSQALREAGIDQSGAIGPAAAGPALALLDAIATRGQVAVADDRLRRERISDDEGARRYRADVAARMALSHDDE